MQNIKPSFTEKEQLVGYLETDSGTLLFADGIWQGSIPHNNQETLILDTETERTKFPVYSLLRGGQRFLLIALDTNTIHTRITEDDASVPIDEPLTDEELTKHAPRNDAENPED